MGFKLRSWDVKSDAVPIEPSQPPTPLPPTPTPTPTRLGTPTASHHNIFDSENLFLALLMGFKLGSWDVKSDAVPIEPSPPPAVVHAVQLCSLLSCEHSNEYLVSLSDGLLNW